MRISKEMAGDGKWYKVEPYMDHVKFMYVGKHHADLSMKGMTEVSAATAAALSLFSTASRTRLI